MKRYSVRPYKNYYAVFREDGTVYKYGMDRDAAEDVSSLLNAWLVSIMVESKEPYDAQPVSKHDHSGDSADNPDVGEGQV